MGLVAPAASYTGIAPGALRSNENRRRFHNFGLGYGGFYGVPYVPYLDSGGGYSSYSSYPSYSEQAEGIGAQSAQSDAQMQQDALAQQLDQMNSEIAHLRENQMQQGPGPYAPPSQWTPPPAPSAAEQQAPQAPITLILQSGAKVSVANYAVMNGVIWDFSKQPARKIPVSAINVAASQKATEDTGGEFPQLNSSR